MFDCYVSARCHVLCLITFQSVLDFFSLGVSLQEFFAEKTKPKVRLSQFKDFFSRELTDFFGGRI